MGEYSGDYTEDSYNHATKLLKGLLRGILGV